MIASFYLMLNLPAATWIRFFVWLVIGLVVYVVYGFRQLAAGTAGAGGSGAGPRRDGATRDAGPTAAGADQQLRRNRPRVRTPKRSESSGTRSSTPWNMPEKSSRRQPQGGEAVADDAGLLKFLLSVPPDRQ